MIVDHDKSNGRVALSTKTLEAEPGDMIKNQQVMIIGAGGGGGCGVGSGARQLAAGVADAAVAVTIYLRLLCLVVLVSVPDRPLTHSLLHQFTNPPINRVLLEFIFLSIPLASFILWDLFVTLPCPSHFLHQPQTNKQTNTQ
jgi:hypothetical protein